MKRLAYLWAAVLVILGLFPTGLVLAQKSLPKVPITYPGDTDQTIIRRAQWIEGARKEGKLVWWDSLNPALANKITAEFNKIYPFIAVNYWRGEDTERTSKIQLEHDSGLSTVDFGLFGDMTYPPRWRKIGITEKFTDIIPGIRNMDTGMYSRFGDWAIPGNNAITPQYNTKLIAKAEAPKSWEELLDLKWKGQIALTADVVVWYVLALGEGGWGIKKTEDFLRKLKQQQPIFVQGHSAGHSLLIAGEFKIMAEEYWYHTLQSQKKGAPVDWIRVKPVAITGSCLSLVKKAPHPNAARLFLEWQFSPQGLTVYEDIIGKGAASPGSGTRLSKALEGLPLVYRTEELVLKAAELNLDKRFADILGVTPE